MGLPRNNRPRAGPVHSLGWAANVDVRVSSDGVQPLHLAEVRDGLADRLGLPAVPQALMRFGYPAPVNPGSRGSHEQF
ncbi:hypothetical protein LZ318_31260 [Saccharopolyspora indica]|uniref:hypothetical protein n=1 Tax=Saccharopolyspora indica TaxID=1229659 RepID=UPI0022EA68F9|nr:hypothetical protein [Saccharopolyspora indica]MDA3644286.1 hypothetical protein [Saccharopolyspora indica]